MPNLFEDNNEVTTDPEKDYFEDLVGEGKKFKNERDLARAKYESDQFIERLKQETAGLRKELNGRVSMEELVDKLKTPQQTNPEPNSNNQRNDGDGEKPLVTKEDIDRLVDQRLTQARDVDAQNRNLTTVRTALQTAWGNDYLTNLKQAAVQLDMSEESLQNMAARQPKAFLRLVGADQSQRQETSGSNSNGGLFSPPPSKSFQPNSPKGFTPTGERTNQFYTSLKEKDPKTYWLPSTQNQMHNDAIKLGERFFN